MPFKSGFVSLIGHPNAGKSTLLNTILKEKVAIVSSKAQTTRNIIRGIYNDDECQIVFLDTPGIHKAQNKLGNYMNSQARSSYHNVECVLLVIDAKNEPVECYDTLINDILKVNVPLILVLNKIDLMEDNEIKNKIIGFSKYENVDICPISALKADNTSKLVGIIKKYLPEGPHYYPDDMITDNPESFLIGEIIREKILKFTEDEIPHSVAISIEKAKMIKDVLEINATIIVERDSQKGIIIGRQGNMIKKIGTSARSSLESMFGCKVRLQTFVKVEKDWRNSLRNLKEFGYNSKDE